MMYSNKVCEGDFTPHSDKRQERTRVDSRISIQAESLQPETHEDHDFRRLLKSPKGELEALFSGSAFDPLALGSEASFNKFLSN